MNRRRRWSMDTVVPSHSYRTDGEGRRDKLQNFLMSIKDPPFVPYMGRLAMSIVHYVAFQFIRRNL
jgi:hypothetical protein